MSGRYSHQISGCSDEGDATRKGATHNFIFNSSVLNPDGISYIILYLFHRSEIFVIEINSSKQPNSWGKFYFFFLDSTG